MDVSASHVASNTTTHHLNLVPVSDCVKLFIGQLPRSYEETEIKSLFSGLQSPLEVNILRDKSTGIHRGCAFVTMPSLQAAEEAIKRLHDSQTLAGVSHPLQVKYAEGELERLGQCLFIHSNLFSVLFVCLFINLIDRT